MKRVSITRKWRRFMAVGCSHGSLIDRCARRGVLDFKEAFKPHTTIHLGDAFDLAALRSGCAGSRDEAEPIEPDMVAGVSFLEDLRPNIYMLGNHEDRVWNLQHHPNAKIAKLSRDLVVEIEALCERLRCELHPWGFKQCRRLGDHSLFHGTVFTENACRDHAEMWGNCIHAHTHRAGMAPGRRADNPVGICVGTLMDVEKAVYAKSRRQTLAWSQGLVWGEYCEDLLVAHLHVQPGKLKQWRMPI